MGKFLFSSPVCIALLLFISSCSKNNNDATIPVVPTPSVTYSKTLLKVYELDTTKQAPSDTVGRWTFTYDDSKRITAIVLSRDNYLKNRTIEYKGSDTFAFRSIEKVTVPNSVSIDTIYYTFANGNYTADTVVWDYGTSLPRGTAKTTFTYQPGTISRSFQNWVPQWSYSATERQVIYQTLSNGNVVHQIDTIITVTNGQTQIPQIFETSVSYLPNPNPFFKLYSAFQRKYYSGGIGNFSDVQYAPPCLISQQISTLTSQTATSGSLTYDYTFRADGYPLTARVASNELGVKKVTKLLFVYAQN